MDDETKNYSSPPLHPHTSAALDKAATGHSPSMPFTSSEYISLPQKLSNSSTRPQKICKVSSYSAMDAGIQENSSTPRLPHTFSALNEGAMGCSSDLPLSAECKSLPQKLSNLSIRSQKSSTSIAGETSEYPCNKCSKVFTRKRTMQRHMLVHREKKHICNTCGAAFHFNFLLIIHMRKHSGETPFTCANCGKKYSYYQGLYEHKKRCSMSSVLSSTSITGGTAEYPCNKCGKVFTLKCSLQQHMQRHREKTHACIICGASFLFKHKLNEHLRYHTGETTYTCDNCGKKFSKYLNSWRHKKGCRIDVLENNMDGCISSSLRTQNVSFPNPATPCNTVAMDSIAVMPPTSSVNNVDSCVPSSLRTQNFCVLNPAIPLTRIAMDSIAVMPSTSPTYHQEYRVNDIVADLKNDEVEDQSSSIMSEACEPSDESEDDYENAPLDLRVPSRKHDQH